MADRTKPYEEARKDAEAFFLGDNLRIEVYLSRYALRAMDGAWIETMPDRTWDRVSEAMARPERDRALWRREFRKLLADFKFVPAGRILFGAKNPRASTLFNCYSRKAWESGCKGITVFREGCRASVLERGESQGLYPTGTGSPAGVCTFCEAPTAEDPRVGIEPM